MKDFFSNPNFFHFLITVVVLPLVGQLYSWFINNLKEYKRKTKSYIIADIYDIITDEVTAAYQLFVSKLKEDGHFSLEEQKEIKDYVVKSIKSKLKKNHIKYFKDLLRDFNDENLEKELAKMVEKAIYFLKRR